MALKLLSREREEIYSLGGENEVGKLYSLPGKSVLFMVLVGVVYCLLVTATPANADRQIRITNKPIIGYYPWWQNNLEHISFKDLTHIIYFCLLPSPEGGLITDNINPHILRKLVRKAHAFGVKVSICVGGWESDVFFRPMASKPVSRSVFIKNLVDFVREYNLDGIDLDWEPLNNYAEVEDYSTLVEELRAQLPKIKLLTMAVCASHYDVQLRAVENLNWVAVMCYDMHWPFPDHSTFEDAVEAMNFWADYGVPKNKLIMGVPFYGRDGKWAYIDYSWIVDTYQPPYNQDWAGGIFFNNIDLIKDKTRYVYENDFGGIMIWELGQDKFDNRSLHKALADTAREFRVSMNPYKRIPKSAEGLNNLRKNFAGDFENSIGKAVFP